MKRYNVISGTALTGAGAEIYEDEEGRFVRYSDVAALEAELAAVRAEKAELLKALVEARELVSGWADYADEYFKTKHRLTDDLAMLDAAINKARSNHG